MYNNYRQPSLRLPGYDYATPGAYFVTICVQHWLQLFGSIQDGTMTLSAAGVMIQDEWQQLPQRFAHVQLDSFVVMPNHLHGVLMLTQPHDSQTLCRPPQPAIPLNNVVGAFKSITTHRYIKGVRQNGWAAFPRQLWKSDYWEHIIRTDSALHSIRAYVGHNPQRWHPNDLR